MKGSEYFEEISFSTSTLYSPSSDNPIDLISNVSLFMPFINLLFKYQLYLMFVPFASILKLILLSSGTMIEFGCDIISIGLNMSSLIFSLNILPALLINDTE